MTVVTGFDFYALNLPFDELNESLIVEGYPGVENETIGYSYRAGLVLRRYKSITCSLRFHTLSSINSLTTGRNYTFLQGDYFGAGLSKSVYFGRFQLLAEAYGYISHYMVTAKKELPGSTFATSSIDVENRGYVLEPSIGVYINLGKRRRFSLGLNSAYFYQAPSVSWNSRYLRSNAFSAQSPGNKDNFSLGLSFIYLLELVE